MKRKGDNVQVLEIRQFFSGGKSESVLVSSYHQTGSYINTRVSVHFLFVAHHNMLFPVQEMLQALLKKLFPPPPPVRREQAVSKPASFGVGVFSFFLQKHYLINRAL